MFRLLSLCKKKERNTVLFFEEVFGGSTSDFFALKQGGNAVHFFEEFSGYSTCGIL